MIELSQLKCFVTVAEELHFGRAAARLNMTQPPLSRQIQLLERSMGCALFTRNSRSVEITHAGAFFLPDAQKVLRLLESSVRSAKDVAIGERGVIQLGFTAASAYEFLPHLVQSTKAVLPRVNFVYKEMVSVRQIEALENGELDIGLLRPPIDQSTFDTLRVSREPLILALPVGHPLTRKPTATWEDLDGREILMYERVEGQYLFNLLFSHFTLNSILPRYGPQLSQVHSMLFLVRSSGGVAVVPKSASALDISEIEYREFSGGTNMPAELYMVWRRDNKNPLVPLLVDIVKNSLAERPS